jgi:hypothetical protein
LLSGSSQKEIIIPNKIDANQIVAVCEVKGRFPGESWKEIIYDKNDLTPKSPFKILKGEYLKNFFRI